MLIWMNYSLILNFDKGRSFMTIVVFLFELLDIICNKFIYHRFAVLQSIWDLSDFLQEHMISFPLFSPTPLPPESSKEWSFFFHRLSFISLSTCHFWNRVIYCDRSALTRRQYECGRRNQDLIRNQSPWILALALLLR